MLNFEAEDMFPSLQAGASGPPPPSYASPSDTNNSNASISSLSMNFARAVALQPATPPPPPPSASSDYSNGYGPASARRVAAPPQRPLYHKDVYSNGRWVSTGTAVASQYLELREEAYELACARNKCFMGATQAYRRSVLYLCMCRGRAVSNSVAHKRHRLSVSLAAAAISGNKALAKSLSKQGHDLNAQMKQCHFAAAQTIFEARNTTSQLYNDRVMDLHGLHVAEAVELLAHMLPTLADEGLEHMYLVTGSGHHSKGPQGNARLLPAVEQFLVAEGYQFTPVADNRGYVGMLMVDLRW